MKIHLVKKFFKFATTFLTLCCRVIAYFLQDFNNFFALFTLVFINGHGCVSNSYVYLSIIIYSDVEKLAFFGVFSDGNSRVWRWRLLPLNTFSVLMMLFFKASN